MKTQIMMPHDILRSQLSRAKEFYLELQKEIDKDINNSEVSFRTSEITEDLLTKLRNCLDKAINLLQESKGLPKINNLSFPFCSQSKEFEDKTKKSPLKDLILSVPQLENVLRNFQPYKSTQNLVLLELHQKGSQQKHHNLTLQEKKIIDERISLKSPQGEVCWSKKNVTFGNCVLINGVPINPETQLPYYVPNGYSLKKEMIIAIQFQGIEQDVLFFCKNVLEITEKIVKEFEKLFK